jgi:signal transduction histidine kinase
MLDFLGASSNRMTQDDNDCVHTMRASVSMMRSVVNDALGMTSQDISLASFLTHTWVPFGMGMYCCIDMTKIESGNIEFESVPFSMHDVVSTLIRVEQSHAQAKGLKLLESIDSSVPRAVLGDPSRIRQVLINFVRYPL